MKRLLLVLALLYASWIGMMLVHELGHILHAAASGGRVVHLDMPLVGFSRTDVEPNPHPRFVAWGGAIWGSLLPLALWLGLRRAKIRGARIAQFFAGFCLVANGAYLAAGWTLDSGDAADLVSYGTPWWVMLIAGLAGLSAGLWLWHLLGPGMGLRSSSAR